MNIETLPAPTTFGRGGLVFHGVSQSPVLEPPVRPRRGCNRGKSVSVQAQRGEDEMGWEGRVGAVIAHLARLFHELTNIVLSR